MRNKNPLHDPKLHKIGDWVVIVGYSDYWDGCEGRVLRVDQHYCFITGTTQRLRGYEKEGAGFQSFLLSPIDEEYNAAVKALGEEYFA